MKYDKDDFYYSTGTMMKAYREKCNITRREMAEVLDCTVSHVTAIERGRVKISANETAVYAEQCGIGAGTLLGLREISVPLTSPINEKEETCIVGICALLQHMTNRKYDGGKVNYSGTSPRASCFNHYCLANTLLCC